MDLIYKKTPILLFTWTAGIEDQMSDQILTLEDNSNFI